MNMLGSSPSPVVCGGGPSAHAPVGNSPAFSALQFMHPGYGMGVVLMAHQGWLWLGGAEVPADEDRVMWGLQHLPTPHGMGEGWDSGVQGLCSGATSPCPMCQQRTALWHCGGWNVSTTASPSARSCWW